MCTSFWADDAMKQKFVLQQAQRVGEGVTYLVAEGVTSRRNTCRKCVPERSFGPEPKIGSCGSRLRIATFATELG